jgi:tetratricopeptide (TPR) repeat protein
MFCRFIRTSTLICALVTVSFGLHAAEPRAITSDGLLKQRPCWSPDGSEVAFTRHEESNIFVYVLDLATGVERKLTDRTDPEFDAVYSPDGEKVLLAIDSVSPNQGNIDIACWDVEEGELDDVTDGGGGLSHQEWPCWSPDSERIAFTSTHEKNQELYLADADGENELRLTNDPAIDAHPCWSPEGETIAFATNRWGDYEIATINIDGTGLRQFTFSAGMDDYPAFSPDGRLLAWTTSRLGSFDIAIADVETGSLRTIVGSDWAGGESNENFVTWVDDNTIGFVSNMDGGFEIYTLRLDESQVGQQSPSLPTAGHIFAASACDDQSSAATNQSDPPVSDAELREMILGWEETISATTTAIRQNPTQVSNYSRRGDAQFFSGRFEEALADYDQMLALDPQLGPSHWRRGIACWFAGEYELGAEQFGQYHTVDAVDRENGLWKFLCDARHSDIETARARMLVYESDDRASLPDVYRMYAGEMTPDELLDSIRNSGYDEADLDRRLFYAELYVGFYFWVQEDVEQAREHLDACLRTKFGREAGYGPNYMWHVARLGHQQLTAAEASENE